MIAPARKVLVVSPYFAAHGGGVERVAERLIREISASGNFMFVWAASDTDAMPSISGLRVIPLKAFNALERVFGMAWPIWGVGGMLRLKRAISDADAVWLHNTLYLGNIVAFYWARKIGKPVIITQHTGIIPYKNPVLRGVLRCADRFCTRPMLRLSSQATFVSDRIAEDYFRRVSFTSPVKIIPNGVDRRVFHPPLPEERAFIRQNFALRAEQPVLLFVGRFVEKKGLAVIKRLAELLPEYRFWLAGRGVINPALWSLPNVHVFRDRSGAALVELYHAADLLVMPSYGEGFPLVIQEAMACGLPVMCGQETAMGSRIAMPLLRQAEVWPRDTGRTASTWAHKIKTFPIPLPLDAAQSQLSEFAHASWNWEAVAEAYSDIFRRAARK